MLTVTSRKLVPALIAPQAEGEEPASVRVYRYRYRNETRYGYCFGTREQDMADVIANPLVNNPILLYIDGFETAASWKLRHGEKDAQAEELCDGTL